MELAVSPEYRWLWAAALGVALFFPVRHLIWVLSVRRVERRTGELPGEQDKDSMKRRAGFTSALLCLAFAAVYVQVMFGEPR